MLARGAVEDKEKRIAAGLSEKFARLAFELSVEQNRGFDGVPVVDVVRRRLKSPDELSRVWIEGDDRAGVKIFARPLVANENGIGIAGAPIEEIELGVVGSRHPSHAAAVEESVGIFRPSFGAGLAGIGFGVPAPLDGSGFRIERFEITANIGNVTRDTGNDVITDHQRSHGGEIAELGIGELDVPPDRAALGVEADHVGVRRGEVEPILVHAQAAIADVVAFRFTVIVPNLAAETSVDGPNVVRRREVENAVYFKGSRFKFLVRGIDPGERKGIDVGSVDLVERAEAPAGIVAVVGGPRVGGGFEEGGGIETLRGGE